MVEDTAVAGGKAVSVPVAPGGTVASVGVSLGEKREQVARAAKLRLTYRFDGAVPTMLHLKIVAAPLAGGFQAIYNLPIPAAGAWQTTEIDVQKFDGPWSTDNPPVTNAGRIEFRIGKPDGAAMTLKIGAVEVTPLPAGVVVNARTTPTDGGRPAAKVTPMVTDALTARLDQHPRLLFNAADRDAIRAKAAKTAWGKAYVADLKASLEPTLAEPLNLPARGGQWYHWYACPKHGTRLKAKSPTEHVCPTGNEVYTGYPYDDVYLSTIHDRYSVQVRDLGLLYQLTGDKRYAERARAILLAYAEKYESYPLHDKDGRPNVGGGKVGPQTLDESTWLIPMAQGCDAIWDTLSPADTETLKTKLFYPAAQVIRQHRMGIHNIQCWKNSAVGLVGLLFGDAELIRDAVDNPERGMQVQVLRGITSDGPWYEGAWGYHFYTMSALAPLAEAAHNAGLPVYTGPVGERYRKLYAAPLDFALPDGKLPAFNDSGTATAAGNAHYELALARWKDARFAAPLATSSRKNWQALVAGADALPAVEAKAEPSRNFTDSGYAVLRSGTGSEAATLELKYGPHGGGHGHPDKLNFVLFMGGRILADDPGTANYGVPIQAGWYKTTLAHNTLVVDGESQKPATGACLDFKAGDGWSAVLADAGPIYDGVRFRRAAFLLGNNVAAFIDLVTTTDGKERTLDFAVHPNGVWDADKAGNEKPDDRPGYSYLRDLRSLSSPLGTSLGPPPPDGALEIQMPVRKAKDSGDTNAYLAFGIGWPAKTRLLTGTGVGRNTEDRVPILILRQRTDRSRIAWTLGTTAAKVTLAEVKDAGTGKSLTDAEAAAAIVKADDASYLLLSNPEGHEVTAGSYRGRDKLAVMKL